MGDVLAAADIIRHPLAAPRIPTSRRKRRPVSLSTKPPTCDQCGCAIGPVHPKRDCQEES